MEGVTRQGQARLELKFLGRIQLGGAVIVAQEISIKDGFEEISV